MNSERSVIEKLNFAKYPAKLILHKPDEIADFNEIAFDTTVEKEKYDLIFIFIFSLEAFSNQLNWVIQKQLLENNGYVYFAYVGDYIHRVNDIQQFLKNNEDVLAKYNQLAPGYQKDWARYVYSAKQKETREKRLLEMEALLAEGYKSIALYRIQKKQQEESK